MRTRTWLELLVERVEVRPASKGASAAKRVSPSGKWPRSRARRRTSARTYGHVNTQALQEKLDRLASLG
jgi:hypothetical protein